MTRPTHRQLLKLEHRLGTRAAADHPYASVSDEDLLAAYGAIRRGEPVPRDVQARLDAATDEWYRRFPPAAEVQALCAELMQLSDDELMQEWDKLLTKKRAEAAPALTPETTQ